MDRDKIKIAPTPNPNSRKFILPQIVREGEKVIFTSPEEANKMPLISALYTVGGVFKIALFANTITITKTPQADWDMMEDSIIDVILFKIPAHDINSSPEEVVEKKVYDSPEMEAIDEVVEKYIRPKLIADGGDLELMKYEATDKVLIIKFEGACASCPSATYGTLEGIKMVLQEKYDPAIQVFLSRD